MKSEFVLTDMLQNCLQVNTKSILREILMQLVHKKPVYVMQISESIHRYRNRHNGAFIF